MAPSSSIPWRVQNGAKLIHSIVSTSAVPKTAAQIGALLRFLQKLPEHSVHLCDTTAGSTCLMQAVEVGSESAVEAVLDAANSSAPEVLKLVWMRRGKSGDTAMHICAAKGNLAAAKRVRPSLARAPLLRCVLRRVP